MRPYGFWDFCGDHWIVAIIMMLLACLLIEGIVKRVLRTVSEMWGQPEAIRAYAEQDEKDEEE